VGGPGLFGGGFGGPWSPKKDNALGGGGRGKKKEIKKQNRSVRDLYNKTQRQEGFEIKEKRRTPPKINTKNGKTSEIRNPKTKEPEETAQYWKVIDKIT